MSLRCLLKRGTEEDFMSEAKTIDMAGLDREVGFALRLAQIAVFKDVMECLKPLSLRPAEYSLLVLVHANPGLKQHALGAVLSVQGPNLATMVDQVESRGLILRSPIPSDRRAHALHLTTKGRSVLRQAKIAHATHQARLERCLGKTSALDLIAVLYRIAAAETWTHEG
jgi:DNA-binding MarR family transcriptional regulator